MLTACQVWGMGGGGGGGEFQVKSTQLLTPMFSFLQYSLHCAQAILLSLSALEYSRAESETMYKLADMQIWCFVYIDVYFITFV